MRNRGLFVLGCMLFLAGTFVLVGMALTPIVVDGTDYTRLERLGLLVWALWIAGILILFMVAFPTKRKNQPL